MERKSNQMRRNIRLCMFTIPALGVAMAVWLPAAAEDAKVVLRTEHFDRDPGWEGHNNRLKPDPKDIVTVVQDFGYSATNFAGSEKGEMGGQVWRCTTPAFYADRIPAKTLNDKLTASGKFAFTSAADGSGLWFGWFRGEQEAGIARPRNGLGLNLDFQRGGGRLAVRLSNQNNKFCGTFITPYIPGKFRPAPLSPNTQYVWRLDYDPEANGGNGRLEFTIRSVGVNESGRQRVAEMRALANALPTKLRNQFGPKHGRPDFDDGKPFVVDLPPGFKQDGATFDHFGLMNTIKEGRPVTIYFDDLTYDGKTENFTRDPNWEGSGNRVRLQEVTSTGYHDFGFSANTCFAGGSPGEMGGVFWRLNKAYGYYADRIGPLTLNDPLEARGKLLLKVGTPDSEMCFGWFGSAQKMIPQDRLRLRQEGHLNKTENFLGVYLAGPSRLGRCLLPAVVGAKGTKLIFKEVDKTPRPVPGKVYEWSINYSPSAGNGQGALTVRLGDEAVTFALTPLLKAEGAVFDLFGFFPCGGGGMVHIFFDDLRYTVGRR